MADAKKPTTEKGGVWQRLLDALYADFGNVVSNAILIEASGQHNYARRIRELRAEGWDIQYSSKEPKGYILRSTEKAERSVDAYINLKLRMKVLQRDGYKCQICGRAQGEEQEDGQPVKLEVDHIDPLKNYGKTVEENLWTLCSRCNAGKKSLLAYPETIKNKIISLNLPDDLRSQLSDLALAGHRTVNDLLIEAIRIGVKEL